MILRKLVNLYSMTIVVGCFFLVSVKAQDSCDCTCIDTSKKESFVCDLLADIKNTLQYVDDKVKEREKYINQTEDMEKKLESHGELIKNLSSLLGRAIPSSVSFGPLVDPEPANLIAEKNVKDDLNETQRDIKNLEDQLHNVTTVIERLDVEQVVHMKLETLKETLLQEHINELRSKLDEVAYKDEMKIAEVRLGSMETKLSDLIDSGLISQMSKDIEEFRRALEIMNEAVERKVQSEEERQSLLKMQSIKLKQLDTIEAQVEILHQKIAESQYGLSELRHNIKEAENKTMSMENELVNLVIRSSLDERQKTADQLENFKTEWILNCTYGISQCFSLRSNQTLNLEPALDNYYMLHSNNKMNPKIQGSLYYGCEPILLGNYPNLQITRNDKAKTVIFSCAKNTTLIGITSTHCQNGKWVPDTPPICVSKSTRPSISECPEIKVGYDSSLLLITDEIRKMVGFKCDRGEVLKGPSFLGCTNGSWVPDSLPKCYVPL